MNDIEVIFKYEDKEYKITLPYEKSFVFFDDYNLGNGEGDFSFFWWQEGNGACDCNRSIVIHEHYPDFPEMDCGDKIELLDIGFKDE